MSLYYRGQRVTGPYMGDLPLDPPDEDDNGEDEEASREDARQQAAYDRYLDNLEDA